MNLVTEVYPILIEYAHHHCQYSAPNYKSPVLMVIKKSGLYSSIWASCDELRGGMDASQYKDYALFIQYVSDKYGDFAKVWQIEDKRL